MIGFECQEEKCGLMGAHRFGPPSTPSASTKLQPN